jgi:hypothetical protein
MARESARRIHRGGPHRDDRHGIQKNHSGVDGLVTSPSSNAQRATAAANNSPNAK